MEDEAIKAQRSRILIKVAMATVILIEAMAFQRTNTLNFTKNNILFAHWEKDSLTLRAKTLGFSRYCKSYEYSL
ncbi:hypothetical protein Q4574_05265 [Aliiglaciecola sp. 3_MG-2023]|uniref:hypothetical protein n=1 Tax=Aliiglaciecola sp. 3_MG-2023 TaxID=3062644 RepID=UPI0026E1BD39|nr:hypothetical protein [Aliiglaciecola sp. 3_MG-2023]MDO6692680.1 hypothetical protein [Aliiglaciecola sp. 3_MG-2023]